MSGMVHVCCLGGNKTFTPIAVGLGYKYGARLPHVVHSDLYFADQNWHKPERRRYMEYISRYRPVMATVLDLEREEQLPEVLDWAEEAAQHADKVLVIPKYDGGIAKLPRTINGKPIVLAYSVPSRYGGTTVPVEEFAGWPVHLLGGNPFKQRDAYLALSRASEVISCDGNYHQKQATRFCQFFLPEGMKGARNRFWPTLKEFDGQKWPGPNPPAEAFRRSCIAIMDFWRQTLEGK